jgi:hypothetical protein
MHCTLYTTLYSESAVMKVQCMHCILYTTLYSESAVLKV